MKSYVLESKLLLSTVLGVGQILTWGMTYYLPAIMFVPLAAEMGWDKTHVVYAFTLALIVSGVCAPFAGRAVVRHSGKKVLLVGSVLNMAGLAVMGLSVEYIHFLIAWALLGAGMSASLYTTAFSTLTEILGVNARKSISTITLWGGLASTLAWPFGAYFIEHVGWRELCFLYVGVFAVLILPMYLFGLSGGGAIKPDDISKRVDGALKVLKQKHSFVTLTAAVMLFSFLSASLSLFLVLVLIADGSVATVAAGIAALMGPSQIAARVIERVLADKVSPLWTLMAANILLMLGVVMIMVGGQVMIVGVVVFGTGKGLISIVKGGVSLRVFGAAEYAVKIGRMERYVMFTHAAAPVISGLIFTAEGSFGLLVFLLCLSVVALPLSMRLMRGE